MNTRQVTVGDSVLHVVDEGSGSPILFVHGFPLDHSMWRYQIEEFSKSYRVVCPDLPGFGESPSTGTTSMQSIAEVLANLLDTLGIGEPVQFCGLSMGGYVGWQFYRRHRSRMSGLIACHTRAANDTLEIARARRISAQSVRRTGSQSVADTMVKKLIYQFDDPSRQAIVASVYDVIAATEPETVAAGQLAMADRTDATPWLESINIPALFVGGEHDEITPVQEMRQNAELVADSQFLVIPDAGHLSPLEQPTKFNQGLRDFLSQPS